MNTPVLHPEPSQNASVAEDACNTCGQLWPIDELELDANLDAICPDCAVTGAELLESDAAAYRAYAYGGAR